MAYKDFHPTIHEMGDEACAAAIIEGTITEFKDAPLKEPGDHAFYGIEGLTSADLPALARTYSATMGKTGISRFVAGPKCYYINGATFAECANLTEVVLLGSLSGDCIMLQDANAFNGTPIADGTGHFYVPKKLGKVGDGIAAYEAATNWSVFAGQLRYIEDNPEIFALVKERYPWY